MTTKFFIEVTCILPLLGFAVTFITSNFDPVKFRQRTIDLSQLISEFESARDDIRKKLVKCLNSPEEQRLDKMESLEREVEDKRNELMLKARVLKSSL